VRSSKRARGTAHAPQKEALMPATTDPLVADYKKTLASVKSMGAAKAWDAVLPTARPLVLG
jgi:hypothetical protein